MRKPTGAVPPQGDRLRSRHDKQRILRDAYRNCRRQELGRRRAGSPIRLTLSRAEILVLALSRRCDRAVGAGPFLLDYNVGKLDSASTIFGTPLATLDPKRVPITSRDRLAVLLRIGARRAANVRFVMAASRSIERITKADARLCVANPYHIIHFAATMTRNPVDVYFHTAWGLTAHQAAFASARAVHASPPILALWDASPETQLVAHHPEHAFISEERRVAVYLTDLATESPNERRLREFAKWVAEAGVHPLRVFLHPVDVASDDWRERLSRRSLGMLIPFVETDSNGRSLMRLSRNQLSCSAASSIGPELLSLGLPHRMLQDHRSPMILPAHHYLSADLPFPEILSRLGAAPPL